MNTSYTNFLSQFGDELVNPSSDRSTVTPSDALAGKKTVMLYFSAHWCPPCRRFTPELINFYKKLQDDDSKSVELVFCSLDNSQTEYNEYTSDMPWLCMPFEAKECKTMASKYKSEGIPHLVIVDGTNGEVITYDGTSELNEDPDGAKFPWRPKSLSEIWGDETKIFANNKSEDATLDYSSLKDKYLMLYFSAHWCPPCREFTPILSEAYTKLKSERDDFELVFISSDKDEESFNKYFKEMTFCALPYTYRETKSDLSKTYGVKGIPKLIMLGPVTDNETGKREIINDSLNGVISNGDFSDFPFYPKNYGSIDEIKNPNETKILIVLYEGGDDDEQKDTKGAVREVAEKLKDDADKDIMQYLWSLSTGGMGSRIRSFLKLPKAGVDPEMVILDLSDGGAYYKCDSKEITVESIMKFVENPGDRQQV